MQYYYDFSLVTLSIILSVLASFTALGLVSRIGHQVKKSWIWSIGGSMVMGVGIWSMHFVGMLAFHLPIPLSYDIFITTLSVVIAVFASAISLAIAITFRNKYTIILSSIVLGSGIAGMHYTGMAALQMEPPIEYDYIIVFVSILISILASYFALKFSFQGEGDVVLLFDKRNLSASLIMGAAIAGMHYTAMAAANFDPSSICRATPGKMDSSLLAVIIGILSVIIFSVTSILLSFDIRFARQNAVLVKKLQDYNENLKKEAEAMASEMTEHIRISARKDRMLAAVIEQTDAAIITVDIDRVIMSWNRAAEKIFGYASARVTGKKLDSILIPVHDEEECDISTEAFSHFEEISFVKYRTQRDTFVYINIHSSPLYGEDKKMIGSVFFMRDITSQHEYHRQMALWSSVYKNSSEGILIANGKNEIISINNAFTRITGYELSEIINKNPRILASGLQNDEFYLKMWDDLKKKGFWKGEIWNRRKNGEIYPEWLNITVLRERGGKICNYVAIFTDATEYKAKEDRIRHMAYHDNLTGLPNRSLMEDRVNLEMAHAERLNVKFGILFLDLDHFKYLNDTYGHAFGDQLLQQVALRLKNSVRSEDTVSRMGGDEFILMIREVSNIETLARIAQKVLENVSDVFTVGNEVVRITPSIGISIYPDNGKSYDELIRNADAAMYHAKDMGRENFQFFTQELNEIINEKRQIEIAISEALENDQFTLKYQPQISISGKKVVGAETLIRWTHPVLGNIPPARFIPIAEDTGKIDMIGKWVLKNAVQQFEKWSKTIPDFRTMKFSINISPHQMDNPEFIEYFKELLSNITFSPETIEIEITETALMRNINLTAEILREIKKMGVSIAIDDFGSGFSSLSYLKNLPIDRLKIDRSFISDIPGDIKTGLLAEAIVRIAQTLDYSVVGEGGETQEQEDFLQKIGCDVAQGFFYSEALENKDFLKFIENYNSIT